MNLLNILWTRIEYSRIFNEHGLDLLSNHIIYDHGTVYFLNVFFPINFFPETAEHILKLK